MSTILVEARRDPQPGEALNAIAQTCRELGHDVFRWRGPQSGRVPHWRYLFRCDLGIIWNGLNPKYDRSIATFRRRGTPLIFTELGWWPQRGHIQIDRSGINANASWAAEPLQCCAGHAAEPSQSGRSARRAAARPRHPNHQALAVVREHAILH